MTARDCVVAARERAAQERQENAAAAQQAERAFSAYQLNAAKAAERVRAFDEVLADIDKAEAEAVAPAEPDAQEVLARTGLDLELEPFRMDEPMAVGHLPNAGYTNGHDLPAMQEQDKA